RASRMGKVDDRPWDQPGGVRRDWEPHRAGLFNVLTPLAGILGTFSLFVWPLSVVSFPLGVMLWVMSRNDLAAMKARQMDPAGIAQTNIAFRTAPVAIVYGFLGLVLQALAVIALFGK